MSSPSDDSEPHDLNSLLPEVQDFRRLGIRPHECRAYVIRSAAESVSRTVIAAHRQKPPTELEQQLSKVVASTYRLLDPRKRSTSTQRMYVGRILPNALTAASQTLFWSVTDRGNVLDIEQPVINPSKVRIAKRPSLFEIAESAVASSDASPDNRTSDVVQRDQSFTWVKSLDSRDLIDSGPSRRFVTRLRRSIQHPRTISSLIVLVLTATYFVSRIDLRPNTLALRRIQIDQIDLGMPDPSSDNVAQTNGSDPLSSDEALPESSELTSSDQKPSSLSMETEETIAEKEGLAKEAAELAIVNSVAEDQDKSDDTMQGLHEEKSSSEMSAVAIDMTKVEENKLSNPIAGDPTQEDSEPNGMAKVSKSPELAKGNSSVNEAANDLSPKEPVERKSIRPSEAIWDEMVDKLQTELPGINSRLLPSDARKLVVKLQERANDTKLSDHEQFVARMLEAQHAWLVEDTYEVQIRLEDLASEYSMTIWDLMRETFVASNRLVILDETKRHIVLHGLVLTERLLNHGMLENASLTLAVVTEMSSDLLGEEVIVVIDESRENLIQAERFEKLYPAEKSNDELSKSQRGIRGRFECFTLGRWNRGLDCLKDTSDIRISRLALQEISAIDSFIDGTLSSETWNDLADQWELLAARAEGRVSNSIRMHAISLKRQSLEGVSALVQLERGREIDLLIAKLPQYLQEIAKHEKKKSAKSSGDRFESVTRPIKGTESGSILASPLVYRPT